MPSNSFLQARGSMPQTPAPAPPVLDTSFPLCTSDCFYVDNCIPDRLAGICCGIAVSLSSPTESNSEETSVSFLSWPRKVFFAMSRPLVLLVLVLLFLSCCVNQILQIVFQVIPFRSSPIGFHLHLLHLLRPSVLCYSLLSPPSLG